MRTAHRRCAFALALLALSTGSAGAQAPDRAFLDSVVTETIQFKGPVMPDIAGRCAGHSANATRLCQGLYWGRVAEISFDPADAHRADDLLTRTVAEEPKWPAGWYGLGRIRLQLARDTVFSKDGPLLPIGASNELGAANALIHALEIDPHFAAAANTLALAAAPRERGAPFVDRVNALRRVREILSPEAIAATAFLERKTGHPDSALALEQRSLATGAVDSGLILLAMARDFYLLNRPDDGRAALRKAAGIATEVAHNAYRTELAWVATPAELATWDSLPVAARAGWITDFWQKRDIAEGRGDGERLVEHYRRIEYAMEHFPITLPQTGRQTALSYTPDMIFYMENEAAKCAMRNADKYPALAQITILSGMIGTDDPHRYYHPIQDQIDDRGIVWIRHGKPTKLAADVTGRAIEIWLYERPEGPLILQFVQADFQGSVGATVLMPTLLTLPIELRNRVCYLETTLCARASNRTFPGMSSSATARDPASLRTAKPQAGSVCHTIGDSLTKALDAEYAQEGTAIAPEAILRDRAKGRAEIDTAITTDTYHRNFTKPIHATVQIYGLEHADGSNPAVVLAFAIPGTDLLSAKGSGTTRVGYPVHIRLMAARARDGMRIDLDTLRQFATDSALRKGESIMGMAELPLPPGSYHVSAAFTQDDGRGAVAALGTVIVPGDSPQFAISDLVLGRAESSVRWNSGTTGVPLNPLNTYPIGGTAEAYFQLGGLVVGEHYTVRVDINRASDAPGAPARLTVTSDVAAATPRLEIARGIGLSNLESGSYRISVSVSGSAGTVTAAGWLTIVK